MEKVKASKFKCHRCEKQAEVFVGLADPDAEKFPMCKECAREWFMEVWEIIMEKERGD